MSSNAGLSVFTKISNIIMELTNVKDTAQAYQALANLISSMLEIENEYFFKTENDSIIELTNKEFDEELENLIEWVYDKGDISVFPEDEGSYIILPITKGTKVLFIYAAFTKLEEFSNEFMLFLRIIQFLMGNLFENLLLYQEILEKNVQIEESKNFLDSILNSTVDSFVVYNNNFDIYFKNKNFEQLTDEVLLNQIKELCATTLNDKSQLTKELELPESFYSMATFPLTFGNEEFCIVVTRDISGTKELEKLKKLDKIKMEFLANISHELRTPLAAIKAYSETIISSFEMLDQTMLKEFINTIYNQSNHLEKLLNDLLDFSKLELNTFSIESSKFDLVTALKDEALVLTELSDKYNVAVSVESEKESLNVKLDKNRIRQVLNILLQNSIKYSDKNKDNKFVKIKIYEKDNNLMIAIEDNGIGIPEDLFEKVFEKFFRVNTSLTYEVSGTGIGLSIAREIINLHKGQIKISESTLGEGSLFEITLPGDVIQ